MTARGPARPAPPKGEGSAGMRSFAPVIVAVSQIELADLRR
ncbi:hypothetical protein N177_0169 [Lutibaculum baratangense AMV1]|uniref:Uncharacterized protein n=1 Tax=Lutibaculum baratangense AMV1 TaxID=631454 RepID=V4RVX3_9HYPH|nr:hypothetical protein N177_0169 [Lutibaculum baratangense AMV1]